MPGITTSFGAVRDIEKWPARDRRSVKRERDQFEGTTYITGAMLRPWTSSTRSGRTPTCPVFTAKPDDPLGGLQRGLKLYNKAIVAALG